MHIKEPFRWLLVSLAGGLLIAPAAFAGRGDDDDDDDQHARTPCEATARLLREAAELAAREDYVVGLSNCLNFADRSAARECERANKEALREARQLLRAQYAARLELCEQLGGGRYDPRIDPRDFEHPLANPFFPLVPGVTRLFEKDTDEGRESVLITVTFDTKTILGIECVVVQDTVTLEGELVEDTLDYFAGDRWGNVWYFGELAMNYVDGELTDLAGSWLAGVEGAKPGIVMKAAPKVGNTYRQEYFASEAEDVASVTGLGRTVDLDFRTFTGCLETRDFTPLDPESLEAKFYAPGIGSVLEVNLGSGERLELVGIF